MEKMNNYGYRYKRKTKQRRTGDTTTPMQIRKERKERKEERRD